MFEVYFDNAATTKPCKESIDKFLDATEKYYANPSSLHNKGIGVEKEIYEVSKYVAKSMGVEPKEIYYTSGGTESNNLILYSFTKNKNIVTIKNQHSSVIEPLNNMSKNDLNIKYIETENGTIKSIDFEKYIDKDTALVVLPHINNETGIIFDIEKIGKQIKEINKRTHFHVDGVQSFGKIKLNLKNSKVDSYSFSSHKIHGLKGLGGLYLRGNINLNPLFYGGEQQKRIRPGTENTFSILALKPALQIMMDNIDNNYLHVQSLKNKLSTITEILPNCIINGDIENSSPYILNISFMDVRGEILLNALNEKKIYVSTGSACNFKNKSGNLLSHGYSEDRVLSAIRFSFSRFNTMEEVEYTLKILNEEIKKLS